MSNQAPIGILYEHPEWFQLLFNELDRRAMPWQPVHAESLLFDPEQAAPYSLVVNRMSPSSHRRGHGNGIFTVCDYLAHLEETGVPVVNGSKAYAVEISKAWQLDLFRRTGVGYPKARVINAATKAVEAARGLQFPVVFKPNVGGSGAGIVRFDAPDQLAAAEFDFGVDGTALIQEFLPARGRSIVRVEVLNGEFLYAIRIWPDFTSFNLCPADICQVDDAPNTDLSACPVDQPGKKKLRIEREDPPAEAIDGALRLAQAAHLEVGGIEYLVDDRTGQIAYYESTPSRTSSPTREMLLVSIERHGSSITSSGASGAGDQTTSFWEPAVF